MLQKIQEQRKTQRQLFIGNEESLKANIVGNWAHWDGLLKWGLWVVLELSKIRGPLEVSRRLSLWESDDRKDCFRRVSEKLKTKEIKIIFGNWGK